MKKSKVSKICYEFELVITSGDSFVVDDYYSLMT